MIGHVLYLVAGLVVLGLGGELLVRGAAQLARNLGISALVVGLTVVAFGTSAPEAAVSVLAGLSDKDALAIGNVVGSCILNILCVMGATALLRPMKVSRDILRTDLPVMLAVFAIFTLLAVNGGEIQRWHGICLLVGLAGYMFLTYWEAKRQPKVIEAEYEEGLKQLRGPLVNVIYVAAGCIGLVWGADLIVGGASGLARQWGASERVIGLTVVAMGTSLPELVTCLVAARHNQPDIAVGNIVGSNIFNILAVIGVASVVEPLSIPAISLRVDIPLMLAAGVVCIPILRTGHRIGRGEGAFLLGGYALYLAWMVQNRAL